VTGIMLVKQNKAFIIYLPYMRIKYIVSLIVLLLGVETAAAQTPTTESQAGTNVTFDRPLFGIGLYASLTSGTGLSFRTHFANVPLSLQVNTSIWKTDELFFYSFGGEVQYDLSVDVDSRFYTVVGAGYYRVEENDSNTLAGPTRIGLGVGYELPLSKAFSVSANLMVTVFSGTKTTILPLPSLGAHIYFK